MNSSVQSQKKIHIYIYNFPTYSPVRNVVKQTERLYIAVRKIHERAGDRPRPAPGLLTPGSRPPPRTSWVCSLTAPGILKSCVFLKIPVGSVDVGTTTTLLVVRALPKDCNCMFPNCQRSHLTPRLPCSEPGVRYQTARSLYTHSPS